MERGAVPVSFHHPDHARPARRQAVPACMSIIRCGQKIQASRPGTLPARNIMYRVPQKGCGHDLLRRCRDSFCPRCAACLGPGCNILVATAEPGMRHPNARAWNVAGVIIPPPYPACMTASALGRITRRRSPSCFVANACDAHSCRSTKQVRPPASRHKPAQGPAHVCQIRQERPSHQRCQPPLSQALSAQISGAVCYPKKPGASYKIRHKKRMTGFTDKRWSFPPGFHICA